MARVGIITFFRDNFGAFLQAYALEKVLNSLGHEVEIINYDYTYEKCILGIPWAYLKNKKIFFLKKLAVEILRYKPHKLKKRIYDKYVEHYLSLSKRKFRHYYELKQNTKGYDVLIAGSDQVFNPQLHVNSFKVRLLGFDDNVKIKASYAASMGDAKIPAIYESCLFNALKQFDYISIREDSMADYLKNHLGKAVYSHCDPTLLLSKSEWFDFSEKSFAERNYTLLYSLKFDERINKKVADLVNQGVNVISVGNRCRVDGVVNKLDVPVDLFISYIFYADRILTNSFHATIFSIIFHKPNVDVFLPSKVGGRIANIVEACGVMNYLAYGVPTTEKQYEQADLYIKKERNRSIEYLRQITDVCSKMECENHE